MDQTKNRGVVGGHIQQSHDGGPYSLFGEDTNAYPPQSGGDSNDLNNQPFEWDPALFDTNELSPSYPQPGQSSSSHFNPSISRHSNSSPSLPQYHSAPSPFTQQSAYQQSFYEPRNVSQPTYDDRFLSRPSASPGPFDQYAYQPQMNYGGQHYNHGHLGPHYQQRPLTTPSPQYGQRQTPQPQSQQPQPQQQQQPQHQFVNLAARPPSQLSHVQNADPNIFHHYPSLQQAGHTFVNPSMLTANNMVAINGSGPNMQNQHQMHPSPYFSKAGPTVDPQVLQHMQMGNAAQGSIPTMQVTPQVTGGQPLAGIQQMAAQAKGSNDANSSKKPKARSSKAKKDPASKAGEVSDSADELEIEEEPPEMTPALLVVQPPTDERGKALYNSVLAVWSPRNKPADPEKIRLGMAAFGETVRDLRDAWKAKNEALKKAELPNATTAADASKLKDDVAHYRQVMEQVMARSLQYGHDSIVKRLGENHVVMLALYSFMLDRWNANDFDSTLVSSIFRFAAKFTTVDEETLETVKWVKILQRFTKKATNESKDLAKQILANAAAQSAKKKANDGGPPSPASANGSKTSVAGVKRGRDGELIGSVQKKVVKPASKPLALQHAERRRALEKEAATKAGNKAGKSAGVDSKSATTVARPKVVGMAAPLKANAFAGLLSASKKPGTSLAEKAAQAAKEKANNPPSTTSNTSLPVPKKEEFIKDSPPRNISVPATSKSASSFLGFLADMDKPKDSEVKKVEVIPDETEEQRAKRLRKESRRKLRVSWKADSDLVQTRLFTHDPDEETGHADSMMRDAGDTVKEGEMLKLHKGVDDVDDDDEEDVSELGEYFIPSIVELSTLQGLEADNFAKCLGPNKPESPASDAQDKYEGNTLMAIYTFKSDRPETPKELPTINDDDDFSPSIDFGEPDDKTRRREKEILMRQQPPQQAVNTGLDLAAQLRAITQQQSQAQPNVFNPDLQRTLNMFNQQPQQSIPGQAPAAGGYDIAKLMAVVQQAQQAKMNQPQPQPQFAQPPAVPSGVNPALAALVAQYARGQPSQVLPLGTGGNPNPYPGNTDYLRKHERSDDMDGHGNRKKKKGITAANGIPPNYKTLVCAFWQEGKCTKGDLCTYKHDED